MIKKFQKLFIVIISILVALGITYNLLLAYIVSSEKSKIYIDTKQNDHFVFEESFRSFPDIDYNYVIYNYDNSKKKDILNGSFSSYKTKLTKNRILTHTKYTEYNYKNIEVKIYSSNNNSMLIYKTSKDKNYRFINNTNVSSNLVYALQRNNKSYNIVEIKNNYEYLIPFYRKLLKSDNKKNFLIASAFLIRIDDSESFHIISENIKLIEPKKQQYFLHYINNYPSSKKN